MTDAPAGGGPEARGFNWAGFLLLGAIVAVLGAVGYWAYDQSQGGSGPLAHVDDLGNGEVRYFSDEHLYLVRTLDGQLLALDDRDTHPDYRGRECAVAWRPDVESPDGRGAFVGRCSGSQWSLAGGLLAGPSPRGLDRYATQVSGDEVDVDRSRLLCGEAPSREAPQPVTSECTTGP
ncbi:MAG TPA: hypothetical protein VNL92_07065 [Dehalococcoidia bacterium]|nr:hypothetical protein [Dehalococcoidia bacterium]